MSFSLNRFMPQIYLYNFFPSLFSLFQFFYIIYIYIYIYIYVYCYHRHCYYYYYYFCLCLCVFTCTDLVGKCVTFPQSLSLVLYLHFRIFYFCIVEFVELWVLVNLKCTKKKQTVVSNSLNPIHAESAQICANLS